MSDNYNGSIAVPRKLTEDEIRELCITLLPYFHASGGSGLEDITDFLDYTFAMISNSKTVDYVVDELIGMEMEFCSPEIAKKVGQELYTFIKNINSGTEEGKEENRNGQSEKNEDNNDSKGSKVVSLKVKERIVS